MAAAVSRVVILMNNEVMSMGGAARTTTVRFTVIPILHIRITIIHKFIYDYAGPGLLSIVVCID